MAIRYEIDEERSIVMTTATGRLTDAELLAHKEALLADPRFRPGMKELSDIRGVEDLDVSPEGVMAAASFDSRNSPVLETHRLGLLVSTDLVFGMARMYEMRTDGNTGGVKVFRSEEEAMLWLDASD
ncbi:MAG: hypothetical protein OEO79_08550 [Gemmatimonadota bacterium]|nr:hypothetical protein [Gemmatimonadota bacterium]